VSLCFWLAAALNHNRAALGLTLTQAVTIVGLGLPLTLRDGVTGTLIAVGVTMLVAFLLSNFYVFRQVPVSVRSVYWGPLAAGAVTFLLLLLAQQLPAWFSLAPIFRLVVIGIIIAGAFGLVLFLLEGRVLRERIRRVRELW
jgi:hypothetical protein